MLLLVQVILFQTLSSSHRLELVAGKPRLNGGDTGKVSETLYTIIGRRLIETFLRPIRRMI